MFEHLGWWLPDGETHLTGMLSDHGQPWVAGRPTYQHRKLRAAVDALPPGRRRVALDVGAMVGFWSRTLLTEFERVIAFEPMAEYRACLLRNIASTGGQFTLHEHACGDHEGRVRLRVYTPGSHGDTRVAEEPKAGGVQLKRIDDCLDGDEPVDLIKVDCEGYELPVLRGAEETLRRCRPVVIVEQKPGRAAHFGFSDQGAVDYLRALGAALVREISGDFILRWE